MIKRILYALPALVVLFSVVIIHGFYGQIVIVAIALMCTHEMLQALSGIASPVRPIAYSYVLLLLPVFLFAGGLTGVMLLLAVTIMILLCVPLLTERNLEDSIITVFALLYPGTFFVFMLAFTISPAREVSQFLLILAFGAAISTDTSAYLFGKLIGKHKLMPRVSPKKTVEGAVGGFIIGAGAVTAAGMIFQNYFGINIYPLWYAILGVALGVLTQIGDLIASNIKRKLCVKDFGRIMGEHGGALDRLDSVLFVSPLIYIFYLLISG